MIAAELNQLASGKDLSPAQMESVMDKMLGGELQPEVIAGFLMALRCKGCLLYTSPSPRDLSTSRMPSSA